MSMSDKIIGTILILACIFALVYTLVDTTKRYFAMLRDERLARIEANERCYKTETWMCYMDEKIRREKAEARANEAERKLNIAKDIMSKAKLKFDDKLV